MPDVKVSKSNVKVKRYTMAPARTVAQNPTVIVMRGDCPHCQHGVLVDYYGICAICLAILLFPIGILCCLMLKERICTNCGARFS